MFLLFIHFDPVQSNKTARSKYTGASFLVFTLKYNPLFRAGFLSLVSRDDDMDISPP
jgi:hypothetical protein